MHGLNPESRYVIIMLLSEIQIRNWMIFFYISGVNQNIQVTVAKRHRWSYRHGIWSTIWNVSGNVDALVAEEYYNKIIWRAETYLKIFGTLIGASIKRSITRSCTRLRDKGKRPSSHGYQWKSRSLCGFKSWNKTDFRQR